MVVRRQVAGGAAARAAPVKLPATVLVGPHYYTVSRVRRPSTSKAVVGLCDNNDLTIRIKKPLPPTMEAEVVLHEVLHAVFASMRIVPKKGEEHCVDLLAPGLLQVFRDNPGLLAYLTAAATATHSTPDQSVDERET